MALHRLHCKRPLCTCEGVPFSGGLAHHRPGTQGCDQHALAPLTRAERRGESSEMLAYIAARMPGPDCPF